MKPKRTSFTSVVLMFALFGCNLPESEPDLSPGDVQTAAAQTVQAALTIPVTEAATEPQPLIAVTLSPSPTVTAAPTGTITPTYSVPMLTVRAPTNCRSGPGEDYEIIFTYLAGKKLEIVGRYDPDNYWLVNSAESPTGTCWLWGEYVDVTGSYWVVSSVTPPPTATLPPPLAPSIQKWDYSCSFGQMTVTIRWTDRAANEIGYRVLRDGEPVAELPANSNSYSETIDLLPGESATYVIQVYNTTETVNSTAIDLTC